MMNSNCLDHNHLSKMVQNEDEEVLKVLNNKEEIYKITFADSQQSTEIKSLLRASNIPEEPESHETSEDSSANVNLYKRSLSRKSKSPFRKDRSNRSPFRKRGSNNSNTSFGSQKEYKYVYADKSFKKVEIQKNCTSEDNLKNFVGEQWNERFNQFKLNISGDGDLEEEHQQSQEMEDMQTERHLHDMLDVNLDLEVQARKQFRDSQAFEDFQTENNHQLEEMFNKDFSIARDRDNQRVLLRSLTDNETEMEYREGDQPDFNESFENSFENSD